MFNEATGIWKRINFGNSIGTGKAEIETQKKLFDLFHVGDYYYYIFNLHELRFEFMSVEVEKVLGYKPDEIEVANFLNLIHPEDKNWFLNFEHKVADFFSQLHFDQVMNYKVRYDYRVRKKSGEYIRILQQVITIDHTKEGGVVKTLGVHTDISHLKMQGDPVLSFIGHHGQPSYIDVKVEQVFPVSADFLTAREREILSKIAEGKKSGLIAKELFISKATVETHRRNLIRKAKVNNIIELVSYAIKKGWI